MIITTTRFGELTVAEEDIISFPEGILGFDKLHDYVLVERDDESLFIWLQAVKKSNVAFPLLEPELFERKYQVELFDEDRQMLELDDPKAAKTFAIITIPSEPAKMTANLKAPVVINVTNRLARQVILEADHPIRRPIFADLQTYCSTARRSIFPTSDGPAYHTVAIRDGVLQVSSP